ncbi:hypothetical protein [Peredibacter starrii]|uniref:Lipoprotein n=1 Tax=Peredibacter starrii TaxID=28202 RepID=A0AAX4HRS0_9BACT|nr:hypothetical protein [Peredibacter starrii]WPU65942.1 hypothetical protein SOO65_04210 [Peredibacter starrii]
MKHTLFKNLIFLTFLSVFVVGCGKDGGGGSSSGSATNQYGGTQGNSDISTQAIQGYNAIVSWKNNLQRNPVQEKFFMASGRGYSRGVISLTSSNTGSSSLPQGCTYYNPSWMPDFMKDKIYTCSGSSGTITQPTVTPTSITERRCTTFSFNTANVPVVKYKTATSMSSTGCVSSGSETTYSIANNTELNQLLNFSKGKILQVTASNGIYTVRVGNRVPENYPNQVNGIYTIDTTKHSIYSPTSAQTSNTEITTIYEAY